MAPQEKETAEEERHKTRRGEGKLEKMPENHKDTRRNDKTA